MRQIWKRINKIKKEDKSMNYFPKTEYWRPLAPNAESVDKPTNPYFKNTCAPYVAGNEVEFVLVHKINMLQYPCVHNNLQNMKKFVSEIFKCTRSGKPGTEEASHIEGCVNPDIQWK